MESIEQMREMGKACFFEANAPREKRLEGLQLLHNAYMAGDLEATFLIGRLSLDGVIEPSHPDPEEYGLILVCKAAKEGYLPARTLLNAYCLEREQKKHGKTGPVTGPLVDFKGKPIKINRKGLFTPIDAVLTWENGQNILTLKANVQFIYTGDIPNYRAFERTICDGFRAWEGEYTVFDGQKVQVRVELTREERVFDNLVVIPLTNDMDDALQSMGDWMPGQEKKEQLNSIVTHKRSFAGVGLKWSASSRKVIFMQSEDGSFTDYTELLHTAKHEFGHALGLGDLYESPVDALPGVEGGTYTELDSYRISEKYYNLVMCDHHGPISNNDIEMVILAFRENKMQLYQPRRFKGKISAALGKGN